MIEELEPTKSDIALEAFKTTRDKLDVDEDGAVTDVNSKRVGTNNESFAVKEIGRPFRRDDLVGLKRRRRLRRLLETIETTIRDGYLAGKNVNQIKQDLRTALEG